MKNYDDNLEKILTAMFGALGMLAVLINLHIKGYGVADILDAIKDMAGLVVVITVFLVANKIFKREDNPNFNKLFEEYLKEWINKNDYLISEEFEGTGKGKFATRFCSMMIDHSNFVTEKKLARDAVQNKEKATFVRLPPKCGEGEESERKFEFRFNQRTFERQQAYRKDENVDLNAILEQFSKRINDKFSHLSIYASPDKPKQAIIVNFADLDETKENARNLVAIVEFVKTMILALA